MSVSRIVAGRGRAPDRPARRGRLDASGPRLPRCGDAGRVDSYVGRARRGSCRPVSCSSRWLARRRPRLRRAVRPGRVRLRQLRARAAAGCAGPRSRELPPSSSRRAFRSPSPLISLAVGPDGRIGLGVSLVAGALVPVLTGLLAVEVVGSRLDRAGGRRRAAAGGGGGGAPGPALAVERGRDVGHAVDRARDGRSVGRLPVRPDGTGALASGGGGADGGGDRHPLGLRPGGGPDRDRGAHRAAARRGLVDRSAAIGRGRGCAGRRRDRARPGRACRWVARCSMGPRSRSRPTSAPTDWDPLNAFRRRSTRPTAGWSTLVPSGLFYLGQPVAPYWFGPLGLLGDLRRGLDGSSGGLVRERRAGRLASPRPRASSPGRRTRTRGSSCRCCRRSRSAIASGSGDRPLRLDVAGSQPTDVVRGHRIGAHVAAVWLVGAVVVAGRFTDAFIVRQTADLAAIRTLETPGAARRHGSSRWAPTGVFVRDGVPDVVELFDLDPDGCHRPPRRRPAELPRHRPGAIDGQWAGRGPALTVEAIRASRGLTRIDEAGAWTLYRIGIAVSD